ncbi:MULTISPECIES: CBS and ACT domain-containing protein [Carnobacterium]|uniref:CBS and ACT domain-containing protein n=1 Tax=Carnobacterium antarcticum TaxID=2126436 RepID=A0ABW4NMC2_9LACT|nr:MULTISPECIES: CBS and ACT domain-containing protein [unclassified Carnobacterium]ALV21655.1 CBS domain protein [Carnobacterium sp. CP1]QQP69664.1 CBS domain-containing protein [Carnobacterium sp. CS13]
MDVQNYMTSEVVTVPEDMKVLEALDIMKEHNFHRLPVVRDGRMVGLVTEEIVQENSPSTATSLSIHEMNYLLTKTTVGDIMQTKVTTIGAADLLEEAAEKMLEEEVGVLPVVEDKDKIIGIITDKDLFRAFIDVMGYNNKGSRIVIDIPEDHPGILEDITNILAEAKVSINQIAVYRNEDVTQIVLQMDSSNTSEIKEVLTREGYTVSSATSKERKE